ncbi:hypothetical protein [Pseudalkalibacillus berkeleyi]|uniref:DUF3829 domain-containing protein n=1 Tax=Pseudalkalibacillus berkeleyi TaxID=1069813 RepID=A0ABS9H2X6_9BACL|nr:hypothetical protein [Pseudalkalibacillus berkeleyi]MCF6138158.1 hypothetical protein [Pseudalkalibacillus berkeleyi]
MTNKFKFATSSFLALSLLLSACGQDEKKEENNTQSEKNENEEKATETDNEQSVTEDIATTVESYNTGKDELAKAKEDKEVDYEMVSKLYKEDLQSLVKKRDGEFETSMDQQITTALEAGKSGDLDGYVVKQIFDKIMQEAFFLTMRHEFIEIKEHWGEKEEVTTELEEAKAFYAALEGTVQKRDAAYSTKMAETIQGGFDEMDQAVENDDELAFQLGKQIVDKTLMRTFYLAVGAEPHGYATKAAKEAKEDPESARVEQAEGWAFYQSLTGYLEKYASEEAKMIESQLNLESDVTKLDPKAINEAFVSGFSKVALHEYEESQEYWGEDKSMITALEGALFIEILETDFQRELGEDGYADLRKQAEDYIGAVKADDQEKAKEILTSIEKTLNEFTK